MAYAALPRLVMLQKPKNNTVPMTLFINTMFDLMQRHQIVSNIILIDIIIQCAAFNLFMYYWSRKEQEKVWYRIDIFITVTATYFLSTAGTNKSYPGRLIVQGLFEIVAYVGFCPILACCAFMMRYHNYPQRHKVATR